MTEIENLIYINQIPMINRKKHFVTEFIKKSVKICNFNELDKLLLLLRSKYKCSLSKNDIRNLCSDLKIVITNTIVSDYLIKRAMRGNSGVLVSTIVLRPDVFSCPKKCSYCPTETDLAGNPTQPKSYLSTEPAMLRALNYNFDVRGQFIDRVKTYIAQGNIASVRPEDNISYKMELILSGGTWESYPYNYRNSVINELYWSANVASDIINDMPIREMLSLDQEITINETAVFRIIGLTLETRPDFITRQAIKDYRRWGVTRIQIGVQHYDDAILTKINRECYTVDTIRAIKLLKQVGLKVVCHLMPDLPGSTPELDRWMFNQAITNPDLQFDDIKIYPTAVCKSESDTLLVKSDIMDWYNEGSYKPYAETNLDDLIEVLIDYKSKVKPWVRIQRLVRDIPTKSIEAGYHGISNLRQIIQNKMKARGLQCHCIRCMEIKDNKCINRPRLVVRNYIASGAKEYHITFEIHNSTKIQIIRYYLFLIFSWICLFLFGANRYIWWNGNMQSYQYLLGFCRLRLDPEAGANLIQELKNTAVIREVHVYGKSLGIVCNKDTKTKTQHKGYGQQLVYAAERIAYQNGYRKMAIIAGVGTREYYSKKCGYHLEGTYMVKYI